MIKLKKKNNLLKKLSQKITKKINKDKFGFVNFSDLPQNWTIS